MTAFKGTVYYYLLENLSMIFKGNDYFWIHIATRNLSLSILKLRKAGDIIQQ